MAHFALTTVWKIPASIESCWFCLLDQQCWAEWWPYVEKVELLKLGTTDGIGHVSRYYWQTCLPYRLTVDITITQLTPFEYIGFTADGDLSGNGACRLQAAPSKTTLQFDWNVDTNRQWMTIIAAVASPIFRWNHQRVMKKGEQSFIRRLNSPS